MSLYAVLLETGKGRTYSYGPFTDKEEAEEFARFVTAEIDPARVITLVSPADELLGYWQRKTAEEQS